MNALTYLSKVHESSPSAVVLIGIMDFYDMRAILSNGVPVVRHDDIEDPETQFTLCGRRLHILQQRRFFEIVETPPESGPNLYAWMAGILAERGSKSCTDFNVGLIAALRGQARLMRELNKRKQNEDSVEGKAGSESGFSFAVPFTPSERK